MPDTPETASLIRYYIDQPKSWDGLSRCIIIKGWCFGLDGSSVKRVRLTVETLIFPGACGFFRPDVKAKIPEAPHDFTGFDVRGVLPCGSINLALEGLLENGAWYPFFSTRVHISERLLPVWLGGGSWTDLMFFQMPGQMVHPPRNVARDRYPNLGTKATVPRLTIITPSFQQAEFLGEAMQSVLHQTEVDCEYIVQDGGSLDHSVNVIRHFESSANEKSRCDSKSIISDPAPDGPRVRLASWESRKDGGQADAISRGFAKTTGRPIDLMAWINSDDFYLPGALRCVTDYFATHPEVDVIYGHRILVDERSREIGRWFLPPHDEQVLRLNDFVPQETLFWRRRVWNEIGGIDPSFKFAMDWDLLLRFQSAGAKIVRVPYFLACFRIHSAQKTFTQLQSVGQIEIDSLRLRTFGRVLPPSEIESHPRLIRYLRKSAWIEFLYRRLGIRHP